MYSCPHFTDTKIPRFNPGASCVLLGGCLLGLYGTLLGCPVTAYGEVTSNLVAQTSMSCLPALGQLTEPHHV